MLRRSIVAGLAVLALAAAAAGMAAAHGATQVSGAMSGPCADGFGSTVTGDLDGCWYTDELTCQAQTSGTVECSGREHFVGSLGDKSGTLSIAFEFSAKYELPFFDPEIRGRCNHRIVGGDGDFEAANGVIHFKDDVTTGIAYYSGAVLL